MSAPYIQAAIPEPFTVLGRRLRPFCIGHHRILARFDCAYVSETSAQASREDLIFAVLVCSMRPKDFLAFLEQENFEAEVKAWGEKVGLFDLAEKSSMFQKYIAAHSDSPPFWKEREGTPSGAHWTQNVLLCMTSELGYTQEEAEEVCLSKALHDYLKHCESIGAVRLMTTDEIELVNKGKECANV